MSFPLSPTNNQQATVNGITYSYSNTTGAWTRVSLTPILVNTGSSLISGTWTFALSSTGSVTLNGSPFVSGSGTAASGTGTTTTFVISNTTVSTGTDTGALQVQGGVGIGGNMYVGGTVTGGGVRTTTTSTNPQNPTVGDLWYNTSNDVLYRYTYDGTNYYWIDTNGPNNNVGLMVAGTDISVNSVVISNTSTLQSVTGRGATTNVAVNINNLTQTYGTNSGALAVAGGVGIGGAVWIGTTSYVAGSQIITAATIGNFGVSKITAGTDTAVSTSTGEVTVWLNSTLQSITNRGSSTTAVISITNTASSTSTNTGALTVAGGVGIGGNLAVGGTTILQQAQEVMVPVSSPGTNATLNFNSGAIFYITGMTNNFTATFVNVPTSTNYVMATSLILVQSVSAAYSINSVVSINGSTSTIRWVGGTTATVTTSRTDVISITLIATGTNAYTVLASGSEYY